MRALQDALEHTPTPLLREMAHFWEVPEAEKIGRPRLVAGLLAQMAKPETIHRALARLDREERDVLRTVLAAGGRLPAAVLTRTYGPLRPPRLAPADPSALNPTERLHRHGLLFRAFSSWDDYRGPAFFIPAELWPHLPHIPRPTPETLLQPLSEQEVSVIPADRSVHRDMACLLALFRRGSYPLSEEGGWPEGALHALTDLLAPPHPAYVMFLQQLARQAHLLAHDSQGFLRPTAEGQQWLRATPALRAQVLFLAWRDHPTWDDLAAIPELLVERHWPADLAAPRGRVLRHLAAGPAGSWLTLVNWLHVIEATDPDFLRPSGGAGRPRVRRRETRTLLEGIPSWNDVEGAYLRFLVGGPLHWLALVELGQGPAAEPAFRLSALGSAVLHPEAAMPEPAEEPVIVEGTLEVWVPLAAAPHAVYLLEVCAERVRWDRVSQYRLTRPTLQRALQRGERVEWLLEALARHGRGEIPQNVAFTLREWAAAYGQLQLRRPIVLKAPEAVLLEEVLSDPAVQAACSERLSPTAVEVTAEKVVALEERLAQLGHLPQVEEGTLPQEERFTLALASAQRSALLALLWAWEEVGAKREAARVLAGLAEVLASSLPPAAQNRARRQKERWVQEWKGRDKG